MGRRTGKLSLVNEFFTGTLHVFITLSAHQLPVRIKYRRFSHDGVTMKTSAIWWPPWWRVDHILIPVDLWTIVHAHAWSIAMIFSDLSVSKCKSIKVAVQSRWFPQPHVLWSSSIKSEGRPRGINAVKRSEENKKGVWIRLIEIRYCEENNFVNAEGRCWLSCIHN